MFVLRISMNISYPEMIEQGDAGMKGNFATRIAGSADLYRVRATAPELFLTAREYSQHILFALPP